MKIKDLRTTQNNNFFEIIGNLVTENDKYSILQYVDWSFLNREYSYFHSANKTIAPGLYESLLLYVVSDSDGKPVTDEDGSLLMETLDDFNTLIANILLSHYGLKWVRMFDTFYNEYNITKEVKVSEQQGTNSTTATYTGKQSSNIDYSNNQEVTEQQDYMGYGASDYSNVSQKPSTSNTTTKGSADNNYTQNDNTNKVDGSQSLTFNTTKNIGGKDLTSALNSWLRLNRNTIFDIIMIDTDKLLTIPVYE